MGQQPSSCDCYEYNTEYCQYCQTNYCGKCMMKPDNKDKHYCETTCCRTQINPAKDTHICQCSRCKRYNTHYTKYNTDYTCHECIKNWNVEECCACTKKITVDGEKRKPFYCDACNRIKLRTIVNILLDETVKKY
jgi:hypothetical protein